MKTGWMFSMSRPITKKGCSSNPLNPVPGAPFPISTPATANSSPSVGDTLQTYRQDARMNGAITFGMNAIVLAGAGQWLRVGQSVSADYVFD